MDRGVAAVDARRSSGTLTGMDALKPKTPSTSAFFLASFLASCISTTCTRYVDVDRGPQAYYQTGFPVFNTADRLERVLASVKTIRITAIYRTYVFPPSAGLSESEAIDDARLGRAADTVEVQQSRRATAVVVGASRGRVTLLTVHHAVNLPDTLVEYFGWEKTGERDRQVRSISILRGLSRWVVGTEGLDSFEVLASDELRDLAFLGVEYPGSSIPDDVPVLRVRIGNSARLSFGSFVYVVGYPAGYPMITSGLVGDPPRRRDSSDTFTVDGVWNYGMSGGLILAFRGDRDALEWVGMARAAEVESEHLLVPEEGAEKQLEAWMPYEGPLYLEETRRILSGVNLSTPMSAIRRFAEESQNVLGAKGYRVSMLGAARDGD